MVLIIKRTLQLTLNNTTLDTSSIRGLQVEYTLRTWSVWSAQYQFTVFGWDGWSVPFLVKAGNTKHRLTKWNILFTLKIKFQNENKSYKSFSVCVTLPARHPLQKRGRGGGLTGKAIFVFYSTFFCFDLK